jgi:ATP-dependent Lon protease
LRVSNYINVYQTKIVILKIYSFMPENKNDSSHKIPKQYAVLPLRDIVVFPGMIVPLFVGRKKSVSALEEAVENKTKLLLVTQKDAGLDDPQPEDLYRIGVVVNVLQLLKLPDGTVKVLVEGLERAEINYYIENDDYFLAETFKIDELDEAQENIEALTRSVITSFENYLKYNKKVPLDIINNIQKITKPSLVADSVATHLLLKISEKQEILETASVVKRFEKILEVCEREVEVLSTERKIRSRVRTQMEKSQKEYYLNEQMKAIKKELGDEDEKNEIGDLEKKISEMPLSKEAKEKAVSELKKLKMMSPMSAEAGVIRNYLEWIVNLPWGTQTPLNSSIKKAEKVLDNDHYGLEKVKERVIEHLAVQQRSKLMRGQIICFVGPPGVGKTSLAKSIAEATGRNFVKISLGGVHDESEIRGHRRTYIGSMPGKIIQVLKKAKSENPLILLDEIDKLGRDFRGDPASALLEVLDPEQNKNFNDHYMEVDYDLSNVMFITTANSLNMPRPLLDRMEVIRIAGYTEDEKISIAKKHLITRICKNHGLKSSEFSITDEALKDLIRYYTRESGVRNLEREIAKLARKSVALIVKKKAKKIKISSANLKKFAGIRKFDHNQIETTDQVGVTTGLAYTEVGGDLLPIEAVLIPGGKGAITITGQLGDVMQESTRAAWSYVRSRCYDFGIKKEKFLKYDIHIHVPEGATPKDGPSAGAAMCTTIISLLTGIPVKRTVAMTGEITLRGQVTPIGGLKEKLLAAVRGGIKTVLIPEKNVKDLEEIPNNIKNVLEIIPVTRVEQVIANALTKPVQPIDWEDAEKDLALPIDVVADESVEQPKIVKH